MSSCIQGHLVRSQQVQCKRVSGQPPFHKRAGTHTFASSSILGPFNIILLIEMLKKLLDCFLSATTSSSARVSAAAAFRSYLPSFETF